MKTFVLGELTAHVDSAPDGTSRLLLRGKSTCRDAGKALETVFSAALAGAGADPRALELHCELLDYFNSSTIAALVQFIRRAQAAGVRLTVVYDASRSWQATSFAPLQRVLQPFHLAGGPAVTFRTTAA